MPMEPPAEAQCELPVMPYVRLTFDSSDPGRLVESPLPPTCITQGRQESCTFILRPSGQRIGAVLAEAYMENTKVQNPNSN